MGQQQRVEILKALYRDARILILDEPTAVLAPQEVEELFTAIRALTAQGRTVIFIAHKLPEVLAISDRIMVMRGGKTVGDVATRDVTEDSLATMMVGREVTLRVTRTETAGDTVCSVANLRIVSELGKTIAEDLTLSVRAGEILGLVGVEGNGQAELLECIAGAAVGGGGQPERGRGRHCRPAGDRAAGDGDRVDPRRPDCHGTGDAGDDCGEPCRNAADGSTFCARGASGSGRDRSQRDGPDCPLLDPGRGPHVPAGTLSGGNMQKVVVARELAEQPKLLLVNQPTRGVDLGATQFIWQSLTRARDQGAAVLLASADLSELLALSDRLVVFYGGGSWRRSATRLT